MLTIYPISISTIQGQPLQLENYKGKKILLVNVASQCGLTPQYAQLQELQETFAHTLQIIGLPCNDFGAQEPGTHAEITAFCETNYQINFPLTEKVKCVGDNKHPLYKFLTQKELNGHSDSEVVWNFQKYLIDETGKLMHVFHPTTEPLSDKVLVALNGL
jgi:glutathione peroxidase